MEMYPHWNARDNYRFGLKKKKRKRDKTDDPGQLISSYFCRFSGMHCPRRNRPSTMPWPSRNDKYTCSCIPAGQLGTIMPSTKRNVGKGRKSELAMLEQQTMKVSRRLSSVAVLYVFFSYCEQQIFFVSNCLCVLVVQHQLQSSSIPWTIHVH